MRLSFSTFACPQWTLRQIADAASRLGYRGVEFRCDAQQAHGVEVYMTVQERRQTRALLEGHGIEVCCLATSLQFISGDIIDQAADRIALAGDLGAPGLRVFCGPLPVGMTLPEGIAQVAENLRYAMDLAQAAGTQLWLQTHDTLSRAADATAALHQAGSQFAGLCYDPLHAIRAGETADESVAAFQDWLRHVHFHDGMKRADKVEIKPLGQGQLPIDIIFAGLAQSGFEGYLSGEWFKEQYGPEPEEALARYHQEMRDLGERHGVHLQ